MNMKIKSLFLLFSIFALSAAAFAQSVVITSKKTTYQRLQPLSEYKKSFTVSRPQIKGASSTIAKKAENTISYEKNFAFNLKEEINEIQWLEEADFTVGYNKNSLLGVTLSMSGSGAYPSVREKKIVVNLKTGNRVKPADIFVNLRGLAAKGKVKQQTEIKNAIVEIKKDPENTDFEPNTFFNNPNFTVTNLEEFSVSDKGVIFYYDYGFPHVALALQPEGEYFFTWTELKPFIKRGGLLARFIR